MKKLLFAGLLLTTAISFSSCKACVECNHPVSGEMDEFCGADAAERDFYRETQESLGYNCS